MLAPQEGDEEEIPTYPETLTVQRRWIPPSLENVLRMALARVPMLGPGQQLPTQDISDSFVQNPKDF